MLEIINRIIAKSEEKKEYAKKLPKKRYLYEKLSARSDYFIGIRGLRGIGKTTMMLQRAAELKNSVYFSADAYYIQPYNLYDLIDNLVRSGYKNIFIDEIHKVRAWAKILKTIYDENNGINVYFSGSSSLSIEDQSVDLSRRVVVYDMLPISFREYLWFRKGINARKKTLKQIINGRVEEYSRFWQYIEEYYRYGGVLYSIEEHFDIAIINSVNKIITDDLPSIREITSDVQDVAHKLVYSLATNQPGEISYSEIGSSLSASKTLIKNLINDFVRAGLLVDVQVCSRGTNLFRKMPKIYFRFPFRYALSKVLGVEPDKGVLREEFFVNHVGQCCYIKGKRGERTPDFMLEGKTFEVGGRSKHWIQNPDYLVVDVPYRHQNKIPLFMFGFLY